MEIDTLYINFVTVQGMIYKPKYVFYITAKFFNIGDYFYNRNE